MKKEVESKQASIRKLEEKVADLETQLNDERRNVEKLHRDAQNSEITREVAETQDKDAQTDSIASVPPDTEKQDQSA